MNIYAFSCLKNGVKFDYPFVESWSAISPLVKETVIAFDDGEDNSRALLKEVPKLTIIDREWPKDVLGGNSISIMTNYALEYLREKYSDEKDAWAILLQADEVIAERELNQLRADIEAAEREGKDCLRFRYLHFWKSHYQVAYEKRWYPQEIRAIKLGSKILNHGDGQTFSGWTGAYESDVTIFHYGHVRDERKYQDKMKEMRQLYYEGLRLKRKALKNALKKDEKTYRYLGPHPDVMRKRIARMENGPGLLQKGRLVVKGRREDYSPELLASAEGKEINFISSYEGLSWRECREVVDMNPSLLAKLCYGQRDWRKLDSEVAREWPADLKLIFACSHKGHALGATLGAR